MQCDAPSVRHNPSVTHSIRYSLAQVSMKTIVTIGSTAVFFAMTSAAQAAEFTCNAKSHTVIIDASTSDRFEYRSWGDRKSPSDAPDLVLLNGTMQIEGTGDCRSRTWTFRSGGL